MKNFVVQKRDDRIGGNVWMKRLLVVELGSLCTFLNGGTPSKSISHYFQGEIPWITGADITSPTVMAARSFITEEAIKCSATNLVPAGTVLFVTRTSVGKVAIAGIPLCFSQDITAITPNAEKLDSGYLIHFLKSKESHFKQQQRGATIQGITREVVSKLKIPLPPLPEQRRIAAILDKADALREHRRQAIAKLDELLQSVFIDMFGDPVTNPKNIKKKTISQLGIVTTGSTPPRSNSAFYGSDVEWIKSDNINTSSHFLTLAEEGLSLLGRNHSRIVASGSTLVTCIAGSRSCIGNAALTNREVSFNQQINAITPNEETNSYFLYTQILLAKRLIQGASTNSMKGMVSKSAFSQIELLSPPKKDQDKFGLVFERTCSLIQKNQKSFSFQEKLFQVFQQRAFTGELFTQEGDV